MTSEFLLRVLNSSGTGYGLASIWVILMAFGRIVPSRTLVALEKAHQAERARNKDVVDARLAREAEISNFLRQALDIETAAHAVTREQNVRLMGFAETTTNAMRAVTSSGQGEGTR